MNDSFSDIDDSDFKERDAVQLPVSQTPKFKYDSNTKYLGSVEKPTPIKLRAVRVETTQMDDILSNDMETKAFMGDLSRISVKSPHSNTSVSVE